MYVASQSDKDWLWSVQTSLYTRSKENRGYVFRKLWGHITDPRNLRMALWRVCRNRGRRVAGVDGFTVKQVLRHGADEFIAEVRRELRSGVFRPKPARRVLIPKTGQPGKFRPLGIPTVKDRVAQAAIKNILEPIFEAGFYPVSYGFRPARSAHGALEHLRMLLRPRTTARGNQGLPYQWAVEGDIKGCFDNIRHHGLMERIRLRVVDSKATRLILAFLKSGILSEAQFLRTETGTPQGGILSPLLANIALSVIEERYKRHVSSECAPQKGDATKTNQRRAMSARLYDKKRGHVVVFPIRYADDFILLIGAPNGSTQQQRAQESALKEKNEVAMLLKEKLGLELSETKTLVTPVTQPMRFLGHHVRVRAHPRHGALVSTTVIPRDRSKRLRERIKDIFRPQTAKTSLESRLKQLNPLLRGWTSYYRHAWGAKRVFGALDFHVWWTIFRWLRKKHPKQSVGRLTSQYGRKRRGRATYWRDGDFAVFQASRVRVEQFKLGWLRPPHFAQTSMESPVRNERRTPGSAGGDRKPTGVSRARRLSPT
jgi:group II intron reverse transcriptase/maturase